MALFRWGRLTRMTEKMRVVTPEEPDGYRFTLKGSPRHYDDVRKLIEQGGLAHVYFGEALAYERGAGIALWRIRAQDFGWMSELYAWWAEMERIEPIQFTFHLYLPSDLKYPALDLREHTPETVVEFIKNNAPWESGGKETPGQKMPSGQPNLSAH